MCKKLLGTGLSSWEERLLAGFLLLDVPAIPPFGERANYDTLQKTHSELNKYHRELRMQLAEEVLHAPIAEV
jgi:hypothetical protein